MNLRNSPYYISTFIRLIYNSVLFLLSILLTSAFWPKYAEKISENQEKLMERLKKPGKEKDYP